MHLRKICVYSKSLQRRSYNREGHRMLKLLNAFVAEPTLANARKIRNYTLKHPMAEIMITPEQHSILLEISAYAKGK